MSDTGDLEATQAINGARRPSDRRAKNDAAGGNGSSGGNGARGSASAKAKSATALKTTSATASGKRAATSGAGNATSNGSGNGPKGGRGAKRRKKKRIPFLPRFRWIFLAFLLLLAVACIGVAYIFSKIELPPDVDTPAQTSFVYDSKGAQLVELHGEQNRTIIELNQMSEPTKQAVLATEDRNFFNHRGIDFRGIIRAGWDSFRNREVTQGGSTLTQQYVKLVYTGGERTYNRKIKEAVMAVKLEQRHSKDEIFKMYMNKVYFGRGAYGVEAAAQAYFGKDAKDLGPGEAALLASLIRSPETADPLRNELRAKNRRDASLDAMAETGAITVQSAEAHKQLEMVKCDPPGAAPGPGKMCVVPARQDTIAEAGVSAFFVDYVRQYLINKYTAERVFKGGLKVYTTIDPALQAAARSAIDSTLDRPGDPEASVVTVDNDGKVLAMIGGRDYKNSQVNLAVGEEGGGSGRQAGSSFKPFTLASAMHDGVSLKSRFSGPGKIALKLPGGGTWDVKNYGGESFGTEDLLQATAHSINTIYAQLELADGVDKTAKMAADLGIRSDIKEVPSLVLGVEDVSPLDMADAYMTFSNRGRQTDAIVVTKVVDATGKVLEEATQGDRKKVLEENEADEVSLALQGVVQSGTGTGAAIGRPIAGKTGTAEEYGDAWFVGYTPGQLATAVWMGYPEGSQKKMTNVHGRQVAGGTFPATIWSKYMKDAVKGRPVTQFVQPKITGKIIGQPEDPCASPSAGASPLASATPANCAKPSTSPTPSNSPTKAPTQTPTPSATIPASPTPTHSPRRRRPET